MMMFLVIFSNRIFTFLFHSPTQIMHTEYEDLWGAPRRKTMATRHHPLRHAKTQMYVYLSICLSDYLLSIYLSIYLLSIYLSLNLSICRPGSIIYIHIYIYIDVCHSTPTALSLLMSGRFSKGLASSTSSNNEEERSLADRIKARMRLPGQKQEGAGNQVDCY